MNGCVADVPWQAVRRTWGDTFIRSTVRWSATNPGQQGADPFVVADCSLVAQGE
jgi:hypothetical protein